MSTEVAAVLIAAGALAVSVVSLALTMHERRRRRLADLSAAHGSVSVGSLYDEHELFILNSGPAIARAIDVWVRDAGGEEITAPHRVTPVLQIGRTERALVAVRQEASRAGTLTLWGRWRDDSGDREAELLPLKRHD